MRSEREPWTCPRCKAIKAPHVDECRCYPAEVAAPRVMVWPQLGCEHEYPFPWHGIMPPTCKRCGQPAQQLITYGGTTASADGGIS